MAPDKGTCQTPVWIGIHTGDFDTYNTGEEVFNVAFERIAEDGNTEPLVTFFDAGNTAGRIFDGVAAKSEAGPICFGESATLDFTNITPESGAALYLSYASMIVPSNDAWISNGNPKAHMIFDSNGDFTFVPVTVKGSEALDAGTEVNDEIPENTALLGQMEANTGVAENSTVELHPGFNATGNILSNANYANADFTESEYEFMSIEVTATKNCNILTFILQILVGWLLGLVLDFSFCDVF